MTIRHGVHNRHSHWLLVAFVIAAHFGAGTAASAQTTTVMEFVGKSPEWPAWSKEEKRLQLIGRFHGRTADTIKLEKLDIPCRMTGAAKLPDRMRNGQRIELQGRLTSEDDKLVILVTRVLTRDTEPEHLSRRASEIAADDADSLLALATEFEPGAKFYEDEKLVATIDEIRSQAVSIKRRQAAGSHLRLKEVLELARSLATDPRGIDLIEFELLFVNWLQPMPDYAAILKALKQANRGWDRQVPEPPERLIAAFGKNAVAAYDSGSDDDRQWLHRLLFQAVRIKDIESQLNPDGSNGILLAALIRREFPEQTKIASSLEDKEIAYRLKRVAELSRRELQELHELLVSKGRADRTEALLNDWLIAQESRFGDTTIGGLLRTADEYLFAAEFARRAAYRDEGVQLLKKAWLKASTESPDDAVQIAERLKSLGWDRLDDEWITVQQLDQMPRDAVQLAASEGRVVAGMTPEQVVQTLGQPQRITRIGSAGQLRELWIYDGDAGLVVRFKKAITSNKTGRAVEEVSRLSGGRAR